MKTKITFTERTIPFILEIFGKSINEEGFIIETNTGELVLTTNGETIKSNELAGFSKNGFFKNDLFSIMELVEKERKG
jgi:hypothetical protein